MVTGGSSGGSAAAVAANLCMVSLGSDTGGSVRQPASFCGVYGFKPTYSRVSRYGLISYASSFDQIGVLSNFIYDNALVLEVISGFDHNDNTSSKKKVEMYSEFDKKSKYNIVVFKEILELKGLDKEIKKSLENLIISLRNQGHDVQTRSFPLLKLLVPTYYVLTTAEASSNLSRYDGVRYGYRDKTAKNLYETHVKSRTHGFGDEVKRRIMLGTFVLSAEFQEAYYSKAKKIRQKILNETNKIFEKFDFIISPTSPRTAFELSKENDDPTELYAEDIFTVHSNLTGNPAFSIPLAKSKKNLPYGVQIQAQNFDEKKIYNFVNQFLTQNI
jgi:aspartyl-tRNA(Asn)/glutamyl-tRNA(Gln) amidotransferase subunit A